MLRDLVDELPPADRRLVTLRKQVQAGTNGYLPLQHNHYARLTLDEGGKFVKLVVSRELAATLLPQALLAPRGMGFPMWYHSRHAKP